MRTVRDSLILLLTLAAVTSAADDPFASQVRPTEPLAPKDQQKTFKLPAGFEIQLFAAEPEIQKPLNMAFDHHGRLWVTCTVEYPHPAPQDRPGRDTIKVLEDTNGDGQADKVTTFADGLNIPMGIYPYSDGVIAFSIPNIWKFQDTNGDGRSDKQTKLYGPFGYERDAHGLNNSFRRHFDGWLYACHGFNNHSTVKGTDGHTITMQSGNTYRMRLEGSRIEQFTWGQVNPFGMAMDEYGNLFTSDCHSKPFYQLLRGGYYPSFGKPHDGLGFVPQMMNHTHGSTAIAGACYYSGENFPQQYRGNLFVGNVMTSRVNRDSLVYQGAAAIAKERPDFVTTTDPWFRPVDIQIGPDGAMYIADFYNRVIGHYEVPLDHPGRDRHRGRIWRVVYTGDAAGTRPAKMPPSLAEASVEEVVAALESGNLTWRTIAMNLLVDRFGEKAVVPVQDFLQQTKSDQAASHALWVLHRLGETPSQFSWDTESQVKCVHQVKIAGERFPWFGLSEQVGYVQGGLTVANPFAKLAAVEAIGRSPCSVAASLLAAHLSDGSLEEDALLRHAARISLRNQLLDEDVMAAINSGKWDEKYDHAVADVAIAVETAAAGEFLLAYLGRHEVSDSTRATRLVTHAARYARAESASRLVNLIENRFESDTELQRMLFESVVTGYRQRGVKLDQHVRDWGAGLAGKLLESAGDGGGWQHRPLPGKTRQDNPWVLQRRSSADGDSEALFLTTLPSGEQATGVIRSPEFKIPALLNFFAAGHIGPPNQTVVAENYIRMIDAKTGRVLAESKPPRNDVAQHIEWQLTKHAGKSGYVEIVDGDERSAYAWLAVGRFSPQVVKLPQTAPRTTSERVSAAASISRHLKLKELVPKLGEVLVADAHDPAVQRDLAEALLAIEPNSQLAALAAIISDSAVSPLLRGQVCRLIVQRDPQAVAEMLAEAMRSVPSRLEFEIAQVLAADRSGAETLVELVGKGYASPRLLTEQTIRQRLAALDSRALDSRVAALIASLPSPNERAAELISTRVERYPGASLSLTRGAESFKKHCTACHQLEEQGHVVGPQLDGIGNRGLERLLEDILDPNRNVDVAFHTTTIATRTGRVVTGLVRREEGQLLVLVDNQGQEFSVAKDEIDRQNTASFSLMPDNFGTTIPVDEFYDLVGYLLSKRLASRD